MLQRHAGSKSTLFVTAGSVTIALLANGAARAQAASDSQQGVIQEVIVTAQKRREPIEFGNAMAPADFQPNRPGTPMINYPYRRAREMLDSMRAHRPIDVCHGHMLKYLDPLTGGWAMPTLATNMRLLPKGMTTAPYRTTATTVFVVVEGEGCSRIGGVELDWKEHDVFVAPAWALQEHEARRESVVFSYSDRAVQEKLNIWREVRG